MGLSATIASGVSAAFSAVGDLSESVNFVSVATAQYNLTTGDVIPASSEYAGIAAIIVQYRQQEIALSGGAIRTSDRRLITQSSSIPVAPKPGDEVIRQDLSVWSVKQVTGDPANATWDMQIRRVDA